MDLIERFRYVMKLNSMTASQFADEIGVQRSSVSHILSGRNKPSLEFIQKVINRFPKVDSTWLINGKTNVGVVPQIDSDAASQKSKRPAEVKEVQEPNESLVSDIKRTERPNKKEIKKVLVFYNDGTFEEFLSASTT